MSEEEESVFDKISRVLTSVDESLTLCTEALTVIAIEMYEARREITKLLAQIKDSVDKLAGKPVTEWKEVKEEVKQPERYEEMVMPSSKPEWMKEETE